MKNILYVIGGALISAVAIGFFNVYEIKNMKSDIGSIQVQVANQEITPEELANKAEKELISRRVLTQKSQDEMLTEAVAKTSPAVVSIVISKTIPELQVKEINPFGNNPWFKNFSIRVPVFRADENSEPQKIGVGSGFLISKDGYIVTNKHVVSDDEAEYKILMADGKTTQARVVFRDLKNDIAVLKAEGDFDNVVSIGNSDNIMPGQTVVAIGDALGEYNNTVSVGVVSGLNRSIEAYDELGRAEKLENVIQTDAAINFGNSGGPLIDLNGNVIGVNVATIYGSNNINFSIPINDVKEAIGQYMR